jgi:hypothetical protein
MSHSPVQRAARTMDPQARAAYHALADHSLRCPACRKTHESGTVGCSTGTTLLAAWSQARRAARR